MKPRVKDILLFQIIAWIIAMNFFALLRILNARDITELIFFQERFMYGSFFLVHTLGGILLGILLSLADIYIIRTVREKQSFGFYLFRKSILYIFLIMVILVSMVIISWVLLPLPNIPVFDFIFDKLLFTYLLYSILISVLIGFISQVNEKFGPGILLPMFFGKYHRPREESRIFIFIDLTSSTTIAEALGHQKFSQLIQDFFFDLNIAANQYEADIYQYVGDEAVLTWHYDKGITGENCIRIFEGFKQIIQSRKEHYLKNYGETPRFKAGLNAGIVMVAEVGYIKKEIAFHGDTINTAARIRSICNDFKVDFLVSENIVELFGGNKNFIFSSLGNIPLKGKIKEIQIFTVNPVV